ncbi:MAG: hypothetical protein HYW24_00015 [Candidatus Aenigmarchaeota archaeon]|nr:hypothetical protein [Candidatus Aenigmarchaeota archaeon]
MESKLIKKWLDAGLKPSSFEFFTNRSDLIVGKQPNQDAEVEYACPQCKFYEIKSVPMEKVTTKLGKTSRKYERPEFSCSKCSKIIKVTQLKKG